MNAWTALVHLFVYMCVYTRYEKVQYVHQRNHKTSTFVVMSSCTYAPVCVCVCECVHTKMRRIAIPLLGEELLLSSPTGEKKSVVACCLYANRHPIKVFGESHKEGLWSEHWGEWERLGGVMGKRQGQNSHRRTQTHHVTSLLWLSFSSSFFSSLFSSHPRPSY